MDYSKYIDPSAPVDVPIRYRVCPFCKKPKNAFVVLPKKGGFLLWCHRCHAKKWIPRGKKTPSQVLQSFKHEKERVHVVTLPKDATAKIPASDKLWFYKYGLEDADVEAIGAVYSAQYRRVIIPYYQDGELTYWTGRYTGDYKKDKAPKYISQTKIGTPYGVYGESSLAIIVEDALSAYKIQLAGYAGVCLFGSYIADSVLKKLSETFSQLTIWLDPDKRGYVSRIKNRADALGIKVSVILRSDKDPKEYTLEEIKQTIQGDIL